MPPGLEAGLLTLPPPPPERPPPPPSPPLPRYGRGDGRRSLLPPRFPSTGPVDPGNARVAPQRRGGPIPGLRSTGGPPLRLSHSREAPLVRVGLVFPTAGGKPPPDPPLPSPANSHLFASYAPIALPFRLYTSILSCPLFIVPSTLFPSLSRPSSGSSPTSLAGLAEVLQLSHVLGALCTGELRCFLALLPRPS